jgi:hypothetical protein
MTNQKSGKSQIDRPGYRLRLARERLGKEPQDVAHTTGMSLPAYFDCEGRDDLTDVISLRELFKICEAVAIEPWQLLSDQGSPPEPLSCTEFIDAIFRRVGHGGKLRSVEDRLGFYIAPVMKDPSAILEWSANWLRDVSAEIGVDSFAALQGLWVESKRRV